MYFSEIKKDSEVYSLIYGDGVVQNVLAVDARIDGFYIFSVLFGKKIVHYTETGIPSWCEQSCETQTVFYKSDIDFDRVDFKPLKEVLSIKKIKKMIGTGKLEVLCPSGLWRNAESCPSEVINKAIKKTKTHLFRIVDYIGKERRSRD